MRLWQFFDPTAHCSATTDPVALLKIEALLKIDLCLRLEQPRSSLADQMCWQRRQIPASGMPQIKCLQCGKPGERSEVGDLRSLQIKCLQCGKPGKRSEVGDRGVVKR